MRELANCGVAYITLAHLFWRDVAADAPALPFLPDRVYRVLFPQRGEPLSELGTAAVEAMLEHRVLIDISHMSARARTATLDLMDARDPARRVPVLATHEACRHRRPLRRREYNLPDDVTHSYDHIGIGSDLDGWIKPALTGLEHLGHMARLQAGLQERYGAAAAQKICSGNARRVLMQGWR